MGERNRLGTLAGLNGFLGRHATGSAHNLAQAYRVMITREGPSRYRGGVSSIGMIALISPSESFATRSLNHLL
jgi:hypothetical protein